MPESSEYLEQQSADLTERRAHVRQRVRAIAYVQLDESNGGIILDIGEGGFAVCAVTSLMDDHLPRIRFQIPQSKAWIEAAGDIVWRSESKKLAGVRFSGLSEDARNQIREWCRAQAEPPVVPEIPEEESIPREARPEADGAVPISASASAETDVPIAASVPITSDLPPGSLPAVAGLSAVARPARGEPTVSAAPKIVRDAATARPARFPSREPGGIRRTPEIVPDNPYGKALQAARKSKQQPAAAGWDPNRWILIVVVCTVLSLAAVWETGRATLQSIFRRNPPAISKVVAQPVAQQTVPLPPAEGPTGKPHGGKMQTTSGSASAGPTPVSPGASPAAPRNSTSAASVFVVSPSGARQVDSASAPPDNTPLAAPSPSHPKEQPSIASPSIANSGAPGPGISSNSAPPPALLASTNSNPTPPPMSAPEPPPGPLIRHVTPSYPLIARASRTEGDVSLRITIGADGNVTRIQPLSGPPALIPAAMDAVSQWRYRPALLHGQPVETHQNITIEFRLPPAP